MDSLPTRIAAQKRFSRPSAALLLLAAICAIGIFGCGHHASAPSPTDKGTPKANKGSGNAGGTPVNDPDGDTSQPKTDMLVARYFGLSPGNCILLTTTSGKQILIDAGPPGTEQDVLARLQQSEVNTLDYVIITCPTAEHIGCMPVLLGGLTHGDVLTPGISAPLQNQVEQVVQAGGGKLRTLRAGSKVKLDEGTSLEVLAPGTNVTPPAHPTQDWYENHSLVFRIKYNNVSLLFTGDMGTDERAWLYSSGVKLRSSILSGLHHGDRRIADIEFVHAVSPVIAILMCQIGNKGGYPHRETLDVLKSSMTSLNRTDVQSDVTLRVRADGQVAVSPARPGTEKELSQAGSGLKSGMKSGGSVQMDNPTDGSDSLIGHESGGLP